jgi:intracellular sulfur oxidation DsrE/DsrF family protein
MHRRNIFRAALAATGGLFAARAVTPAMAQNSNAGRPSASKVAYHLSDADKVTFVLGNIQNHLDGGPRDVEIVLVVHGPALKAFHAKSGDAAMSKRVETFSKAGVRFDACGNTMKSQKVGLNDLVAGFKVAEQGGVVRLAELQSMGYVYLRP